MSLRSEEISRHGLMFIVFVFDVFRDISLDRLQRCIAERAGWSGEFDINLLFGAVVFSVTSFLRTGW